MRMIFDGADGNKEEKYITKPFSLIGMLSQAIRKGVYQENECG